MQRNAHYIASNKGILEMFSCFFQYFPVLEKDGRGEVSPTPTESPRKFFDKTISPPMFGSEAERKLG